MCARNRQWLRPAATATAWPCRASAWVSRASASDRRRDHSDERPKKAEREREKLPAEPDNGHVKLFVNRGARSGISEENLRWALTEGAVIPDSDIGAIRVLERFSFVELPDEQAKLALERLDGTKLEGRQIRVEYAKD